MQVGSICRWKHASPVLLASQFASFFLSLTAFLFLLFAFLFLSLALALAAAVASAIRWIVVALITTTVGRTATARPKAV